MNGCHLVASSSHATNMQTRAIKFCMPDCGDGCCILDFNKALKPGHEA